MNYCEPCFSNCLYTTIFPDWSSCSSYLFLETMAFSPQYIDIKCIMALSGGAHLSLRYGLFSSIFFSYHLKYRFLHLHYLVNMKPSSRPPLSLNIVVLFRYKKTRSIKYRLNRTSALNRPFLLRRNSCEIRIL